MLLTRAGRAPPISCCPGASYVEKEASYTNDGGRLQAAVARAAARRRRDGRLADSRQPRGGAGRAARLHDAAQVRADIAQRVSPASKELDGIAALPFGRPVAARHWLQASNPSERWKWDFMFQDLPPVKGTVELVVAADAAGRDSAEGSEIDALRAATFSSLARGMRSAWRAPRRRSSRGVKADVTPLVEADGVPRGIAMRASRCRSRFPTAFTSSRTSRAIRNLIPTALTVDAPAGVTVAEDRLSRRPSI